MRLTKTISFLLCSLTSIAYATTGKIALLGQVVIEHDPRHYFDNPLQEFYPLLSEADVVFTNLEGAIKGKHDILTSTRNSIYHHSASPKVLDFLSNLKINVLSIANNHIFDYGSDGIASTIRHLAKRPFVFAGAGLHEEQASAALTITIKGLRLALIAFATVRIDENARALKTRPGVNLVDINNINDWQTAMEKVALAKKSHDMVMVYHHFQTVGTKEWQRQFAHAAIDAGASLYVSHGEPHVDGIEIYNKCPIFYNLGNFIFQTKTPLGHYSKETWQGVVSMVNIEEKRINSISFTPITIHEGINDTFFLQKRGFPSIANHEQSSKIFYHLQHMSEKYDTTIIINGLTAQINL